MIPEPMTQAAAEARARVLLRDMERRYPILVGSLDPKRDQVVLVLLAEYDRHQRGAERAR